MKNILAYSENYRVVEIDGEYAVFKRCTYPSGDTSFYQQWGKWYQYKAYAMKRFNNLVEKELKEGLKCQNLK